MSAAGRDPITTPRPGARAPGRGRFHGFTLLELVVVVAIVATLAGAVIVSLGQTHEQVSDRLVLRELTTVREAVRRFRQDTGYLPKTGPFGLVADDPARGGIADPATLTGFSGAAAWRDWFRSPANLEQLLVRPDIADTHPLAALETWDPGRARGWRGPYLTGRLGRVLVGSGLAPDGGGDPLSGPLEQPVPALADAYEALTLAAPAPPFAWPTHAFAWFGLDWDGTQPTQASRRPLLLLQLDDPQRARVVSLGADGAYAPHVVPADPGDPAYQSPVAPTADDLGLFLLR